MVLWWYGSAMVGQQWDAMVVCCVAGSACCAPAVVPLFCSITVMPRDESGRPITVHCRTLLLRGYIIEAPKGSKQCNVDPILL